MMPSSHKFIKKQHYIPEFYLKNFSEDRETLNVYDKIKGEYRERQPIRDIAHENNFYTYKTTNGTKENLEDFFCNFEKSASVLIKKMLHEESLSEKEIDEFSLFLALLYLRTPISKSVMNKGTEFLYKDTFRKMLAATPREKFREFYVAKFGKEISDIDLDDLIDFGINEKRSTIRIHIPNSYWIKEMLQLSVDISPVFAMLNWVIYHTDPIDTFVLSDNPFLLIAPKKESMIWGVGILTPGVRKVVPLTPNMCLIMYEPEENPTITHKKILGNNLQQLVNGSITRKANRCIFSSSIKQLHMLVQDHL